MGEKYGVASNQKMTDIRECGSYEEAIRVVSESQGNLLVVWYAHGQWWF